MGRLIAAPLSATTPVTNGTVTTEYYLVRSESAVDLIKELNTMGPGDGSGQRFDALTTWSVKVVPDGNSKHCRISILLPRALNYDSFNPSLKKAWDTFSNGLAEHEKRHAKIIGKTFDAYKSQDLSTIADAILNANNDFDKQTNHQRDIRGELLKAN